jgi:kynurenine formamidase
MMDDGFFAENGAHMWIRQRHFHKGLRTVDQIELKEMILPLVCIDVHGECAKNPDYTLTLERVKKWETEHGKISTGAFVAVRRLVEALVGRREDSAGNAVARSEGASAHPGLASPERTQMYDVKPGRATICLPLLAGVKMC